MCKQGDLNVVVLCLSAQINRLAVDVDTAHEQETGTEVVEEVDADGDGYPLWSSTVDIERADCDDDNPLINPNAPEIY